jgi:hypothetical protein
VICNKIFEIRRKNSCNNLLWVFYGIVRKRVICNKIFEICPKNSRNNLLRVFYGIVRKRFFLKKVFRNVPIIEYYGHITELYYGHSADSADLLRVVAWHFMIRNLRNGVGHLLFTPHFY